MTGAQAPIENVCISAQPRPVKLLTAASTDENAAPRPNSSAPAKHSSVTSRKPSGDPTAPSADFTATGATLKSVFGKCSHASADLQIQRFSTAHDAQMEGSKPAAIGIPETVSAGSLGDHVSQGIATQLSATADGKRNCPGVDCCTNLTGDQAPKYICASEHNDRSIDCALERQQSEKDLAAFSEEHTESKSMMHASDTCAAGDSSASYEAAQGDDEASGVGVPSATSAPHALDTCVVGGNSASHAGAKEAGSEASGPEGSSASDSTHQQFNFGMNRHAHITVATTSTALEFGLGADSSADAHAQQRKGSCCGADLWPQSL
jgi:hypothetical protein